MFVGKIKLLYIYFVLYNKVYSCNKMEVLINFKKILNLYNLGNKVGNEPLNA